MSSEGPKPSANLPATIDRAAVERVVARALELQAGPAGDTQDRLTEAQLRMWFTHAADPSAALLNVCLSYRITNEVDVARLHDAVDAVAHRFAALGRDRREPGIRAVSSRPRPDPS